MKHLAPIKMFGPGKGDFRSEDPRDRDFRTEVEKLDDDEDQDPAVNDGTDDETTPDGAEDTDGSESTRSSTPAVPKD